MTLLLSPEAVKTYAEQFTEKVIADAYPDAGSLTGEDLLKLTPVRQVNIGILNQLADRWEKTAQAFESPYFDFGHPEVREALRHLLNTASRHISLKKEDLRPLLAAATADALQLLLDPQSFLEGRIHAFVDTGFSAREADLLIRQVHIHGGLVRALALRLQESPVESVSTVLAKQWLAELIQTNTLLDPVESYVSQFSEVYPLKIVNRAAPAARPEPVPTVEKSFFDTVFENERPVAAAPRVTPAAAAPAPAPAQQPAYQPPARPAETPPAVHKAPEAETINNRYKVEVPEVTDAGKFGHVQVKVESISKGLSLGQRFMFINQLFDGRAEEFTSAMEALDQAPDLAHARRLIDETFAARYGWNLKGGEAENELLTIVKRRFS